MKIVQEISLLAVWLLFLVSIISSYTFGKDPSKNVCKEDQFLKPYILLRSKKNGPVTAQKETPGVIDLRNHERSFICLNGAVVIYNEVITKRGDGGRSVGRRSNGTNGNSSLHHMVNISGGESIRFTNSSFRIFNHACFLLNWLPKDNKSVRGDQQLQKLSMIGMKAAGMFLVAPEKPSDAGPPSIKLMFNKRNFDYKIGASESTITDASFVDVGNGPHCLEINGSTIVLKCSADMTKGVAMLCRWSLSKTEKADKVYNQLFRGGFQRKDYKWVECPPSLPNEKSADDDDSSGKDVTEPFATYKQGNIEIGKSSLKTGSGTKNITDPDSSEEVIKAGNEKVAKIYLIELEDCTTFPKYDAGHPECAFMNGNASCQQFEKLNEALELGSNGTEDNLESSSIPTLNDNWELQWKQEVLSLVASIFSKICLPIRKQSVFQLMQLIGNYIAIAHASESESSDFSKYIQKSSNWEIIISHLNKCNQWNNITAMEWEWSGEVTTTTVKPLTAQHGSSSATSARKTSDSGENGTANSIRKREMSVISTFEDYLHIDIDELLETEGDDEEVRDKLIIERSPADFQEDDASNYITSEFIPGTIPRWRRTDGEEKLALPFIQEYVATSPDNNSTQGMAHKDFIYFPDPSKIRIKGRATKQIFYHQDYAELAYNLNPVIDAFWQVLSTVMGYCKQFDLSRGPGLFSVIFDNFYGYFLDLLKEEWKKPSIRKQVELISGEFLDEDRKEWLATCLETAYILSDSLHLRPARPLDIDVVDYMDEAKGKGNGWEKVTGNSYVSLPEDAEGGSNKYFVRRTLQANETSGGVEKKDSDSTGKWKKIKT